MIFDGMRFVRTRKSVTLPTHDEHNNLMPYVQTGKEHYTYFGNAVSQGKPVPAKAIKTRWTWSDGSPVYATPVKDQRHSLTNMVYGGDGRVYLYRGGEVYSTSHKRG